jgi:tetratricopeptide (TPR) repeat protein
MKNLKFLMFVFCCLTSISCKKTNFLNTKPDESLVIPKALKDYQAMIDHEEVFNGVNGGVGLTPAMSEGSSDNLYIVNNFLPSVSNQDLNLYVWAKDVYTGDPVYDWNVGYKGVFHANVILDGIKKLSISSDEQNTYDNILGSALFHRAHLFYQLAQVFAPPYDKENLAGKFGIPLRLSSDIGEKISRASLKDTYDKILNDLLEAKNLLPETSQFKSRPSKIAADALLARVYQTMEDYDKALYHAESCLGKHGDILDYNTLNPTPLYSFQQTNSEIIFYSVMRTGGRIPPGGPAYSSIDTALYQTYNDNDLRKSLYFKKIGVKSYFIGYSPSFTPFTGLATDEVYFIRAECYARKGNSGGAMTDLNNVMRRRWRNTVPYPIITALDSEDALSKVLIERRKELVYRGLRWTDLRRLNQEPKFAITIKRVLNGITYTLPANDSRYTCPIPNEVISFNPNMPQNLR